MPADRLKKLACGRLGAFSRFWGRWSGRRAVVAVAISLGTIFGDVRLRLNGLQEDGAKVGETVSSVKTRLSEMGTAGTAAVTEVGDKLTGLKTGLAEAGTAATEVGTKLEEVGAKGKAGLEGVKVGAEEAKTGILAAAGAVAEMAKSFLEMFVVAKVIETVGEFIHGIFEESSNAQTALAQMNAALDSTHHAAGMTAEQLIHMAEGLQAVTAYSKEDVMSAQNLLLTFTNIGHNVFPQATTATLDLATALHTDLKSASILVGKALNDPIKGVTALKRVGVTLDEQQIKSVKHFMAVGQIAKAQAVILGELTKETGKSAEAYGNTLPGQIARAKHAFNEVKETIGNAVVPVIQRLIGWVVPLIENFGQWLPHAIDSAKDAWHRIEGAIKPVTDVLSKNAPVMTVVRYALIALAVAGGIFAVAALTAIIPALWGVATSAWAAVAPFIVAAAPFAIAAGLIVAIGIAAKEAYEHFKPFHDWVDRTWKVIQQLWQQGLKGLQDAFQRMQPYLVAAGVILKALWDNGLKLVQDGIATAMPYVLKIKDAIGKLAGEIGDRLQPIIQQMLPGLVFLRDHWQAIIAILFPVIAVIALVASHWKQIMAVLGPGLQALQRLWMAIWPSIQMVLSGVWNVIVGVVKVAWALLSGIIKIGLDLLSGNWKRAWTDLQDMMSGIWAGIQQMVRGVLQEILGMVIGWARGLLSILSNIPGPIGDMAKGAAKNLDAMQKQIANSLGAVAKDTNKSTAEAKTVAAAHTLAMRMQVVKEYSLQRQQIVAELQKTTDPVKKHALEQQLAQVSAAEKAAEGSVAAAKRAQAGMTQAASDTKNQVVSTAKQQAGQVSDIFDQQASTVQNDTSGAFTQANTISVQQMNDMRTKVKAAWQGMSDDIKGISTTIQGQVNSLASGIQSTFDALGPKLYNSGRNMMQMLIDGISSMHGALASASAAQAQTIHDNLGFHSPTREGPGRDADSWMPNLMNMLADGIDTNGALLGSAAARAAMQMRNGFAGGDMGGGTLSLDGGALGAAGIGGAGHTEYHTHNIEIPVTVEAPPMDGGTGDPEEDGASFGYSMGTQISAALVQAGYRRS